MMRMKTIEGSLKANDHRFAIVVSKFNEFVTSRLLVGALNVLHEAGAEKKHIEIIHVPGAFEIPLVAKHLANSGRFDAIVCLGAVIRGETPHFEYISAETSGGIARASLETGVPIVFGVLTTDTGKQALERSSDEDGNRGSEAARTAVQMASLMRQLNHSGKPAIKKAKRPAKKTKR